MRRIMEFCDKNVIRFYYVPRIFSNIQLSLRPEKFGDTVIFTNHHEPLQFLGNRVAKRLFDIVFSAFVLLMISPLFPIIALIIKMQSKGPVFFKQLRTGLNGESFMCYKFRSVVRLPVSIISLSSCFFTFATTSSIRAGWIRPSATSW